MNQPIHTKIKPAVKTTPELFELTWAMIENLNRSAIVIGYDEITVISGRSESQTYTDLAIALEIILQCQTFSPGVFERKNGSKWQRAGETQKHENTEGC